jgi:hypothetical protein
MSKRPDHSDDNLLIARCLDGELSADQMQELVRRMRHDDQLRQMYLRHSAMQAMLHWVHGTVQDSLLEEVDPQVVAKLLDDAQRAERQQIEERLEAKSIACVEQAARQRRREEALAVGPRRRDIIEIPKAAVYAAAAAVAVVVALAIHQNWPDESRTLVQVQPPAIDNRLAVATLTGSLEAEWGNATLSTADGTLLEKGPYELVNGFVEIASVSGATLVVEAPARFEILSRDCVQLKFGKLTGDVPPQAVGFSVNTPLATVVDLGTAFGVGVDEQHNVKLSVFEGEVEALLSDSGKRTTLARNRSVAVTMVDGESQLNDSPIDPHYFVRHLPTLPAYARAVVAAAPVVYWRFESAQGGVLVNEVSSEFYGEISPGITGSTGIGDGVMKFEAANLGLVAHCDDRQPLPLGNDYTIEFWMKTYRQHLGGIVAIGLPNNEAHSPFLNAIYVGVGGTDLINNGNPQTNVEGMIRFSHRNPPSTVGGTSCFSSSPYVENEWQHVTAVRRGTAMELYVDGKLSNVAEDATGTAQGLLLHLGRLRRDEPIDRQFVGEIDEFALYDHALEPDVIRKHVTLGRPNSLIERR